LPKALCADFAFCAGAVMRFFFVFNCFMLCHASWPVPFALRPETLPNVEVSLDAPSKPLPDISDEVSKLEADHEATRSIHKDKLVRAFNKELVSARGRLAAVFDWAERQLEHRQRTAHRTNARVSRNDVEPATSFLSPNVVEVVVAPNKHVHESANGAITNIEHARDSYEDSWLEASIAEMSHLTDVVVATVESEVRSALRASASHDAISNSVSLLQLEQGADAGGMGPIAANVQVVESKVPYPTVQSFLGTLEARRDVSAQLEKSQTLSMYLKLLEFDNMLIGTALKALSSKHEGARS